MRLSREHSIALLVALAAVGSTVGSPAMAQDPAPTDGPLCLLDAGAMGDLVGIPMATVAATALECAYSADPTQRQIQVVVRVTLPDNMASDPGGDPLLTIRYGHPANGHDTTIVGRPAWLADDGAWVDVRPDVLGVWLNSAFDDDPPPSSVAADIAEAVAPLYLAQPRPSPTLAAGLPGRFPAELAGRSLDMIPYPPEDYLQIIAAMGPPASDHVEELRAVITGMGTTVDALQIMDASVYDDASGSSIDIVAIQAPGLDVTPLLVPAESAFIDFTANPPEAVTIAGHQLAHLVDAEGGEGVAERWFAVDGDVLWVLNGPRSLVEAFLTALPPSGGR